MHNISSPRSDDVGIEDNLKALGKTAPRVTPADVEKEIDSEHYFTARDGVMGATPDGHAFYDPPALRLLTFCVLVLRNGFTVTGESACASPENYDPEIGARIARQKAIDKMWPLLGFRLKDQLSQPVLTDADAAADLAGTPRPDWTSK